MMMLSLLRRFAPTVILALTLAATSAAADDTRTEWAEVTPQELAALFRNKKHWSLSDKIRPVREELRDKITTTLFHVRDKQSAFPTAQRRRTQEGEDQCIASVIYADDDDAIVTFADRFDPVCTCDSAEATPETFLASAASLGENSTTEEVQAFIDDLNESIDGYFMREETSCINSCSSCFLDYCAIMESSESMSQEMGLSEPFTLTDMVSLLAATDEETDNFIESRILIEDVSFADTFCMDLTEGAQTGKVCFALTFDFQSEAGVPFSEYEFSSLFADGDVSCSVTLNGDSCASCTVDFQDLSADPCIAVDCANLVDGAVTDSCSGDESAGFVGPFEPFYAFYLADDETLEVTVGDCNAPATADNQAGTTDTPADGGVTSSNLGGYTAMAILVATFFVMFEMK